MDMRRESLDEVMASLGGVGSLAAVRRRLSGWKCRPSPQLVDRLYDEVVRLAGGLAQARRVASAAHKLAREGKDGTAGASQPRTRHVDYLSGLCADALAHYQSAISRFENSAI